MNGGGEFATAAQERLLDSSDTAFVMSQPISSWTETQVLAFLNLIRLPLLLQPELYNGKQLLELSQQEIRRITEQAKVYHDKIYDPEEAASRLTAALAAVKSGNQAELYNIASGKFTDAPVSENSSDFSVLVETCPDEFDEEYANAAFPRLFEMPGKWALLLMAVILAVILLCLFVFAKQLKSDDQTVGEFRVLFIKYASIPITMVPFTYFHIWLALWMTFYPVFFVGCWRIPGTNIGFPFGWQGIVPFKSVKMAKMAVDMITNKLITVKEVFLRLDPDKCAEILQPHIAAEMERVIQEVLSEEAPRLWGVLPRAAKQRIVSDAARDSPTVVKNLLNDLRDCIDDCFDLEGMVIKVLLEDMEMCNDIFIKVSHKELAFIRNAGAWMGGIFGAAQMVLWIYFRNWWVLPLLGFIVGAVTNWLALLFIFRPIEPIYLCNKRYKLQGLFLQRQKQVSSLYAKNISSKVMTPENLNEALMNGPKKELVQQMAAKHIEASFEKSIALLRSPPLSLAVKRVPQAELLIATVKQKITQAMCKELYPIMRNLEPYMGETFDLNNTLRTRMSKLPFADFEGLMHPIFKEDEPKLILMGGVLGVALGLLQMRMF